jgi:hypothetical protein
LEVVRRIQLRLQESRKTPFEIIDFYIQNSFDFET